MQIPLTHARHAFTIFALLMMTACASFTDSIMSSDARTFTRADMVTYISGKTQVWSQGGGYHMPDTNIDGDWGGTLYAKWAGKIETGTWSVTEDGQLCWYVPAWRAKECATYYHDGKMNDGSNTVTAKIKGVYKPAAELRHGNVLDDL